MCSIDYSLRKFCVYTCLSRIGKGFSSTVKLCRHRTSGKLYALKVLRRDEVDKLNLAPRVLGEKLALGSISPHPRVIRFYMTLQDTENLYFLLEAVSGGELYRHLRVARIDSARACGIASEIVCGKMLRVCLYSASLHFLPAALRHIHSRGFVYRRVFIFGSVKFG